MSLKILLLLFIFWENEAYPCILTSSQPQICSMCSFNYYDSFYDTRIINTEILKESDCLPKNTTFLSRNILIIAGGNSVSNLTFFDENYTKIYDCLYSESSVFLPYLNGNLTIYLSKGTHFIIQPDYFDNTISFFERTNVNILILPLYCDIINITEICVFQNNSENPTIYFKYGLFSFSISNRLEIRDLYFEMIDLVSTDSSCLLQDFTQCCNESTLNQNNSFCQTPQNYQISSSKAYTALFETLTMFDDPEYLLPEIFLQNVEFNNTYFFGQNLISFRSFISCDEYGCNVIIEDVSFNNFDVEGFFFAYNTLQNSVLNNRMNINIFDMNNVSITNGKISSVLGLFYIMNFNGNVSLDLIDIKNITNKLITARVAIYFFQNITTTLQITQHNFNNCSYCSLIYGSFVNISANNLTMELLSWTQNVFYFDECPMIFLEEVFLGSSETNFIDDNSFFLLSQNSNIFFNNSLFLNLTGFAFSATNSLITFSLSRFKKHNFGSAQFQCSNSNFYFYNTNFTELSNFVNLFYFTSSPESYFVYCLFANSSGSFIFSGASIMNLTVMNSLFNNISGMTYAFSKSTSMYSVFLSQSSFSNLNLGIAFLSLLNQVTLIISFCTFEFINFKLSTTANFIAIQNGNELIENCVFINIFIMLGGSTMIKFMNSDATVINSYFKNNGWVNFVNVHALSSLDYINLFYIWTCTNALFDNNTFINEGAINLFSGFIHCTLHINNFTLTRNSFQVLNQTLGYYHMGVIISNAPIVIISDNEFSNLECPDFSSFIHNYGVLTAQGDNTFQQTSNHRTATVRNLIFNNCSCKNAGSLGVINFNSSIVSNITIKNSNAESLGGGLLLACSTFSSITNISFSNTSAYLGSIMYLRKIVQLQQEWIFSEYSFASWDGGSFYIYEVENMVFTQITILNSACINEGGVFKIFAGETQLINSYFFNCSSQNSGGVFYLTDFGNLTIRNFYSQISSSFYGGCLYISSSFQITLENISIFESFSDNKGAAFYIDLITNLSISLLKMENCQSLIGGILYLKNDEMDATYTLVNLTCVGNSAEAGSCIFGETRGFFSLNYLTSENCSNSSLKLDTDNEMTVKLLNCSFLNSFTFDYIIFVNNMEISLKNIVISQNIIKSSIFYIEESNNFSLSELLLSQNSNQNSSSEVSIFSSSSSFIQLNNIIFHSDFSEYINFIVDQASTYLITTISIQNINHFNKALILCEDGILEINDFEIMYSQGPIINCIDCETFELNSGSFIGNFHQTTDLINDVEIISKYLVNAMKIFINNTIFQNTMGMFSSFSDCLAIVFNSTVFTGGNLSQAIEISDTLSIMINNTFISNFSNQDENSHGIQIKNDKSFLLITFLSISSCFFNNNQALYASSLLLVGNFEFNLTNSNFTNNTAIKSNTVLNYGIGGVSYTFCYNLSLCEINIVNCYFYKNFAENICPTFYSNSLISVENCKFVENADGSNFSTTLTSFPLKFITNISEITSGVSLNITFILLDVFNEPFHTQSEITSLIIAGDNQNKLILQNVISTVTENGYFNFPTLLLKAQPNSTVNLDIIVGVEDLIFANTDTLEQSFSFFSRSCLVGEIYGTDNTCTRCPEPLFALFDPMTIPPASQKCSTCLTNALCLGGSYLIPEAGYWRPSKSSLILTACIIPNSCTGFPSNLNLSDVIVNFTNYEDNEDLIHGSCAMGQQGNLCFACIQGYGKDSENELCLECSSAITSDLIKGIAIGGIVVGYLLFNANFLKKKKSELNALMLKIFQNHLQKLSLIVIIQFQIGTWDFSSFLSNINKFSLMDENSFANECFMQDFTDNSQDVFAYKLFFILALPTLGVFCCAVVLKLFLILKQKFKKSIRLELYMIYLISIFLFYPLILKNSLTLLNCFKIDETENEYLYKSPDILCWTSFHRTILAVGGIIGILYYGIFFPIYLMLIIRKNISTYKSKLSIYSSTLKNDKKSFVDSEECNNNENPKNIQEKTKIVGFSLKMSLCISKKNSNLEASQIEESKKNIDFYRFFFKDYKKEYFYWESVIFLLKFFLCLVSNIANLVLQEIADVLFVFFLCFYILLLIKKEPFKIHQLNKMDFTSNVSIIISKLTSTIFQSNSAPDLVKLLCYLIFIMANMSFVLFLIFNILKYNDWKKIYKKARSHYGRIHKIVATGIQRQLSSKITQNKKTKVIKVVTSPKAKEIQLDI